MPPSLTSSPPLLPRLYLSVLCNKIIKEDSALHCGRQRSPQTLETRINNVLVRLRTAGFSSTGAYVIVSLEPLGGFDPPMAQTSALAKKKNMSHFQLDPPLCGTVRAFFRIFPQLWRTVLFIRIDPMYILELLIDISATIEQCISVIASKCFRLSRRRIESTQRFKNKEEKAGLF